MEIPKQKKGLPKCKKVCLLEFNLLAAASKTPSVPACSTQIWREGFFSPPSVAFQCKVSVSCKQSTFFVERRVSKNYVKKFSGSVAFIPRKEQFSQEKSFQSDLFSKSTDMKIVYYTFNCIVILFSFFPSLSCQKYYCEEFSTFQKRCEIFDLTADGCEKHDQSRCPPPEVRHNVYCPVYSCHQLSDVRKKQEHKRYHNFTYFCFLQATLEPPPAPPNVSQGNASTTPALLSTQAPHSVISSRRKQQQRPGGERTKGRTEKKQLGNNDCKKKKFFSHTITQFHH